MVSTARGGRTLKADKCGFTHPDGRCDASRHTEGYCYECGGWEVLVLDQTTPEHEAASGLKTVWVCIDKKQCSRNWRAEMDARAGREPADYAEEEPEPWSAEDEAEFRRLEAEWTAEAARRSALPIVPADPDDLPFD